MTNYIEYLSQDVLNNTYSAESVKEFSSVGGSKSGDLYSIIGAFSNESVGKLNALLANYKTPMLATGHLSQAQKNEIYMESLNNGVAKFAKECVESTKRFNSLPEEIKGALAPVRNIKLAVESKLEKLTEAADATTKFALKFERDQAKATMESMIFGICANLIDRDINTSALMPSFESVGYQQAIPYPRLETAVQWVNCAATVYPKLAKTKALINQFTSVVVHTQEIYFVKLDDNNRKVAEVLREDLFSVMDPSKEEKLAEFFEAQTRELTVSKANFNKQLDLRKDNIYHIDDTVLLNGGNVKTSYKADTPPVDPKNPTPAEPNVFITGNEQVRSDFRLVGMAIDGKKEVATTEIFDYNAGKVLADIMAETDRKGKVVPVMLDEKKPDEQYFISLLFDGQEQKLLVVVNKSKNSMPDIEALKFEFRMNDLYNVYKPKVETEIRTKTTMINAGPIIRDDIPNLQEQFNVIDQRQGGSILTKLTNLTAERQAQHKEMIWYKGYSEMKARLRKEYVERDYKANRTLLYTEAKASLDLKAEVMKDQAYRYELGMTLRALQNRLNLQAKSQIDVQMNMLTSTFHLPVLGNYLSVITGTVNEESNGTFLGVQQEARTNVMTLGLDTSSPVMAIVVGSDKLDLAANPYKGGDYKNGKDAPGNVAYNFEVIPYYKETNLETTLLVETPGKVIADPNYRAARRPFTPNIQVEFSATFKELRGAAADLVITGANVHLI